jgi:murein DD-endopeptidase MepM/ murein hydrolase activator NlpD
MSLLFRRWMVCSFTLACIAQDKIPTVSAQQGTLIRWGGPGTTRCSMKGHSWAALKGACYYPIDLEQPAGRLPVARSVAGKIKTARITIEAFDYGTEEITLPDIPQANPSPADLKRDARERVLLGKVFNRKEGPAKFTLPLGRPAQPLPPGKAFGVNRVFNGKPASQRHNGIDYPTPVGSPVLAVADGTVVLADDLFYEGNAVFIDHGDGLISMYFHLSDIAVKAGQEVKKGHSLGRVGSTGRATGPHLFFGIRWHNARIDPKFVLEDPGKIPTL